VEDFARKGIKNRSGGGFRELSVYLEALEEL
jgi:hypothetical protein